MDKLLVITLSLSCLPSSSAFSSGAPARACEDMFPVGHGVDSQQTKPPFAIRVSQTVYNPSSTYIIVEISAYNGTTFGGFFLQSRGANCRGLLGEFKIEYKDWNNTQHVECDKYVTKAAVTHSSPVHKTSQRFTWTNSAGGDVYFQATIVENYRTFWAGLKSVVVRDQRTLNMTSDIYPAPCPSRMRQDMFPKVSGGNKTTPFVASIVASVLMLILNLL